MLVEEHVDGPEVTVNAFSLDGDFVPLTVTDRLTAAPPAFGVALAHVWPSAHDAAAAIDVARRGGRRRSGSANGPSYTQVRLGPDGPVVMEVAARLGGGHDAELCRAALGVDLNALAVAAALGEPSERRRAAGAFGADRAGGVRAARASSSSSPPAGGSSRSRAPPRRRRCDGIEWVRVYRRPGHVFGPLRRGADRAGAVLAAGADRDEALARARRAADAVRFRVDADAS